MNPPTDINRQVRLAGLLYLAIILLGLWGELAVRGTLVVAGDAAATAERIAASPLLWRSGLVGDLLMQVLDVPVIVVFYLLLRPVSESLALTATLLNLVQTAVLVAERGQLLTPLLILGDAGAVQAFSVAQQQAFSQLAIRLHSHGFGIGLIFFGFACLIRAWLIYRSGLMPRAIALLLGGAGICYLVNSFALLLAPELAAALFPAVLLPALVGEASLCFWMMFRGIDLERWRQLGPL